MLKELDVVRLLAPVTENRPDGSVTVPADAEGTVLDIYHDGEAFGVDFLLEEPRFTPDDQVLDPGLYEYVIVPADRLRLVTPWKA